MDATIPAQDPQPPLASHSRIRLSRARVRQSLLAVTLLVGIALGVGGRGLLARAPTPQPVYAASTSPAASPSVLQASLVHVAEQVGPAVVSVRTDQGLGSGVIYDAGGLVLTNAHVVDGATSVSVRLADGRRFDGQVLGADPGFDVAVVKIDGHDLPAATLGDSTALQVGQFVVAIGNPYGYDHTVTTGVVSALNRPISEGSDSYVQPMIQTDAAINPGNSGGPLVDLEGNVVGITTLVAAPQGFPAQGLGFAVPVNTAGRIAPQLAADGQVTHSGQPYLGVSITDLSGPSASQSPYGRQPRPAAPTPGLDHGAAVRRVAPGGPAAQASLRVGDVLTALDGKALYGADDFLQELVRRQPGDHATLQAVRQGQTLTLDVTIGEAPAR